ncbi:MAG: O-phospho-L-seryl-tRNA:Cys-tRNA synthase [Candidatus Aenigmarchaeota archaeon ex4484_52]|nr:MAG: O-phospho-L-seryl-tRNA:Cys-tRNA synthase [Candidatus Aenigmarchaeota archaeon ex4484_52]
MTNQKKNIDLKRQNKDLINLNPIQTGGKLTDNAKKALIEFGDGYAVCDFCNGVLDEIQKPDIKTFVHQTLPEFLNCDIVQITNGAREGVFIVMHSLAKPNDIVLIDQNAHYSCFIAAQRCKLNIVEVKNNKCPIDAIDVENYIFLIEKYKPKLILLTYPDGTYGNLPDAKKLGKIAQKYRVPYLLNCAYAIGRMPVKMKEIGADFVIGSGHKSMAATGPIGVLGINEKYSSIVLEKSKKYPNKIIECLGCTARGTSIITLMASFDEVKKRVENWEMEVKKAQWFAKELEKLGFVLIGQKPHKHDLMFFKTDILYEISKKHKKKGYFLYYELKKRGIVGIKPGHTKSFKLSSYGISKEKLNIILDAFRDIIKQNL